MNTVSARTRAWLDAAAEAGDECVEWPYGRDWDGYGIVHVNGRARRLSHLILAEAGQARPPGTLALHSCDNPPCGNLRHLRWGSPQANMDDKMRRGRYKNGRQKLSTEDLARMRAMRAEGASQFAIASRLGVVQTTIGRALRKDA